MGIAQSHSEKPPSVVLVPPLFERDLRLRTRMAHSSYDYMFSKPALRFLFEDYMQPTARAFLSLRPAEDPRISVYALLNTPLSDPEHSLGQVNLRYQPDPDDYASFIDIKATGGEGSTAKARACLFNPKSGLGFWGSVPLVKDAAGSAEHKGQLGLRYSSPSFTSGAIFSPSSAVLEQLWLGGRYGPISVGMQTSPHCYLTTVEDSGGLKSLAGVCQQRLSYCVAYTPTAVTPPGRGTFTAAVEVSQQQQLVVSFLYHLALQRNIRNPFEGADVVGITNYLDVGLQLATEPPSGNGDEPPVKGAALAVAWQVNRGLLLKGKLASDSIAAAIAVKSWANPSWTAAVSATWMYGSRSPKLGLTFGAENHGNVRYERSRDVSPRGSSVVQRHIALRDEIESSAGQGKLVPPEQFGNVEVLGQVPRPSDDFL